MIIKSLPYNSLWEERESTDFCVIHHAAAIDFSFEQCNTYHIHKGWNSIGYHFYIEKNGKIYEGRPIDKIGAHTYGYNDVAIGICLEGNFEIEKLEPIQRLSLIDTLNHVIEKCPKIKIVPHSELNDTNCPAGIRKELGNILSSLKNGRVERSVEDRLDQLEKRLERLIDVLQSRNYIQ